MNRKGFTLLELMIAVAIIGVLVRLAVPNFQTWVSNQRLRDDMSQIETDIQIARITAINRNGPVTVVFNQPTVGQYTVFTDNGQGGGTARDLTQNGTETTLIQRTLKAGITFSLVDFNGGSAFLFNPRGFRSSPSSGNSNLELQTSQGKKYRVSVTLMGDVNVKPL
jgi:type IV fimbrial biogenesis protein FimT